MFKPLIFTIVILLFFSCKQTTNELESNTKNDTTAFVSRSYTQSIFLTENARKEMVAQKYFEDFENTMKQFYNSTPDRIQLNAQDLTEVISKIKDSISLSKIDRPDVKARFNILYSEALRLIDMSTIITISNEEVNRKIENIIYAYESILAKINQVYLMDSNEENVDVQFQAPKVLSDTLPESKELIRPEKKLKQIKIP